VGDLVFAIENEFLSAARKLFPLADVTTPVRWRNGVFVS